ncbi:hypothetical protein SKAU_G00356750 [Synaphobranchus kaupii]|uniref:Uncharacterized protein n=1 Tax=Synaphobranchus kaupii TaxID=118154 RepID=A0A9Q1EHI4_SYNKA|nr:hypothetical protein SKAU_G00356750 [Synaphobranchus kaupii]
MGLDTVALATCGSAPLLLDKSVEEWLVEKKGAENRKGLGTLILLLGGEERLDLYSTWPACSPDPEVASAPVIFTLCVFGGCYGSGPDAAMDSGRI